MIARSLISTSILPLHDSMTEQEAKSKMNSYRLFHLPVINKHNIFLGLLAEEDIINASKTTVLSKHPEKFFDGKVYAHQHIFEIYDFIFTQNVSCVAVVDDKNFCLGVLTCTDLMKYFGKISGLQNRGAIIILTVLVQDYNLSQISRIIEENDAKIISLYSNSNEDSTKMDVILKLNTHEISSILQSFNRFNYTVKTYFEGYDKLQEMYKHRIDSLLNYLNI